MNTKNDRRDETAAVQYYDRRFEVGYMAAWPDVKRWRVAELIRELDLPQKGRALDFGCGTGVFTEVLTRELPGWQVMGTDLSPKALATARSRLPACSFFALEEAGEYGGQFDLVFTHHVLEHVSDIRSTARSLTLLSGKSASMFHVLPCGNPGSFDEWMCLMRTDGIQFRPERVFFFEEEGHLRRLDTVGLLGLWADAGFCLMHEWYAFHTFGALERRTAFGLEDVLAFADPKKAINTRYRVTISMLRVLMIAIWALRKPMAVVRAKTRHGCQNLRDYGLLAAGLALYPVAWAVESLLERLEAREWRRKKQVRAGGEMFIHLAR